MQFLCLCPPLTYKLGRTSSLEFFSTRKQCTQEFLAEQPQISHSSRYPQLQSQGCVKEFCVAGIKVLTKLFATWILAKVMLFNPEFSGEINQSLLNFSSYSATPLGGKKERETKCCDKGGEVEQQCCHTLLECYGLNIAVILTTPYAEDLGKSCKKSHKQARGVSIAFTTGSEFLYSQ